MRYVGLLILCALVVAACDSGGSEAPCELAEDETYTFSAPFTARSGDAIALFEFEQEVRRYETGDCSRPAADVNEVSLVVRNLTACSLQLDYRVSVISAGDGWTYEGDVTLQPRGAFDQGVIQRDSPIRIGNAQAVVSGTYEDSGCTNAAR
jgi:hypothetical protein